MGGDSTPSRTARPLHGLSRVLAVTAHEVTMPTEFVAVKVVTGVT